MESGSKGDVFTENSRSNGSLGFFLCSQLVVLSGLDFSLRLALAVPDFGLRQAVWQCFEGTISQLTILSPVLVLLGLIFYRLRSRAKLLLALVLVIDLIYVLAGFSAYINYIFFRGFPPPSAILDLKSMNIISTAVVYILPRPETPAFVAAPMVLLFLTALYSMRLKGRSLTRLGFAGLALTILVAGFVPYSILGAVGRKNPEYVHLHPLTPLNFNLEFASLEEREIPREFVRRLRRQAGCGKKYLNDEYPLYKLSPRKAPFPQVLKNGLPNLVIVIVESFAAVNIGVYGNRYELTPNFDSLAREGIFFSNVRSTIFSTTAAEINILCSQSIRHSYYREVLKHKFPSLVDFLKRNGYKDAAWFHNGEKEFEEQDKILKWLGFDEIYDISDMPEDCPRGPWGCSDKSLMKFAVERMEGMEEPFVALILTVNNHPPFSPFPEDGRPVEINSPELSPKRRKSLQMVHYSDEALGKLMELSGKRRFSENTVFAVTADHEIREEEVKPPLSKPSDVLDRVKIPFVIWSPLLEKSKKVETNGYQADVAPTILELLGISTRDSFMGAGLLGDEDCYRAGVSADFIAAGDYAAVLKPDISIYRLSDYSSVKTSAAEGIFRRLARDLIARETYYPLLVRKGRLYPP